MKMRSKILVGMPINEEFWMKVLNEKRELSVLMFKLSTILFTSATLE